jgi:hypothetical protein
MANFVGVLKSAIEGLGDDRSSTRERVYQKARAVLAARLDVVGAPPLVVVERQKRVLEDAIAEVEGSYFNEVEVDPSGELASIGDCSRHPAVGETAALDTASMTERAGSTLLVNDHAPEHAASTDAAAITGSGELQNLPKFISQGYLEKPSEPTIAEAADFQVPGEGSTALGIASAGVPSADRNTMEFGAIRLDTLALEASHQLGWDSSSLCGLCQRWAVCIDQAHCWHRTND